MRPLLAAALVVVILGSVWLYLAFVASIPTAAYDNSPHEAEGVFAVKVTLTFEAGSDAFTVDANASPVEVLFRGRNLVPGKGPFDAGVPIVISPVEGILERRGDEGGVNRFSIRVIPKPPEQDDFALDASQPARQLEHAVRVSILRDGETIVEQTLWSEPGQPVQGEIELIVEPRDTGTYSDH
jgi:hypothetical protein